MKKIVGIITIAAASIILNGTTLLAAGSMGGEEYGVDAGRDECLLLAKNCPDSVDSINQRIERLNREIMKGADVYTADELQKLRDKLDDTLRMRDGIASS
jgi:hypothetical protein